MSGTDPYVPGHGDAAYDVDHYDLDLLYRPSSNRLDGEVTLHCRAVAPIIALDIDLHHLKVAKLSGSNLARWAQRGSSVKVTLKTPAKIGDEFTITIKYSGNPGTIASAELGDAGWEELADGAIVAAQPHGAPAWFPCNDRPDTKGTYTFSVTAPSEYYVAASGSLESSVRSGSTTTWDYQQRAPMASYLAAIQIGRYVAKELTGPTPLRVVAPSDLSGPGYDASFGKQPDMMAFFSESFGPYPFEGYTSVITDDDLEIPLESQSLSTFGRNFASADWDCVRLVAHELAHQWFGNAVTLKYWRDIWLHEGFACYAEWLWSEAAGSHSAQDWAEHFWKQLRDLEQDILLADPTPALMFDDRVYKRGALTLHSLRRTVGDEAFFAILRSWVAENMGGTVTTADFVAHCQRSTGRDLAGLFEDWLHKLPVPDLGLPG